MKQALNHSTVARLSKIAFSFGGQLRGLVPTAALLLFFSAATLLAQAKFDDRRIDKIDLNIADAESRTTTDDLYRPIIVDALGTTYSATRIRDSIDAVYKTQKIISITVSAAVNANDGVDLTYLIRRKPQADKVAIVYAPGSDEVIAPEELLLKLNIIDPGASITEQLLQNNANQILDYFRERGYLRSQVKFTQNAVGKNNAAAVEFTITPNVRAKVKAFRIDIDGLMPPVPANKIKLQPGEFYSREQLTKDVESIKVYLRKQDFVAPELGDPQISYDPDTNLINLELKGKVGPAVKVTVEAENEKVGESTQVRLLPIKREGTLDYGAIVEGERRLESYFQENGYFFAEVTPICSIEPPLQENSVDTFPNNSEFLCSVLANSDLDGKTVEVNYKADLDRKLKLTSLRIRGTDKLPIDEIKTVLESQEANILGIIPLFGYGRGYTSLNILERDAATIRSLMNELGYRDAEVRVNQGVSLTGDELIITFVVDEGPPTVVTDVAVTGNTAFTADELLADVPQITGRNYSRARVRNAVRKISEIYSKNGYFDAKVTSSIVSRNFDDTVDQQPIKVEFRVENEGRRVKIDQVLVTGNEKTKTAAILKAAAVKPGEYLRSTDLYSTEQNLYGTDVFDRVEVKPQPAGNAPNGDRESNVIINVHEQAPRLLLYGGGFSTDFGVNGFFDIRHVNLLGNLWQGGARIRVSQRQQLIQFDFVNPRFLPDGEKKFAPLTITAQYQRDSTVTRFFRSAFDKGTFGIVQRVDEDGNPIDIFGNMTGDPTINRLSVTAETNKTLSRKNRRVIYARYRFEDVRLSNVQSLLIKDLLLPDSRIRISGFGFTFAQDTRRNCAIKYSLLEIIAKGDPGDPCRYNSSDPTDGSFLTAEYNISIPQLGANIGFHKFQASFNTYYTFPKLRNITLAGRAVIGLASVFSSGNRFTDPQFADLEGILPISERFFAGGSTTIRGFDFEQAGPRVVIVPQGTFLNSNNEPVFLDPFTVPFGGNALAIVNLEARIPINKSLRLVPFYDGGNVFRRVGDIFNPPDVPPNDVFRQNLRALWTHTVGLGLRIKTPVGGEFAVDYGYLLNPPKFLIPQGTGPNAIYRLHQGQLHFRFSQAF